MSACKCSPCEREFTGLASFDRHQDFATGRDYKLSKISKSNHLGKWHKKAPRSPHDGPKPKTQKYHHTANVRFIRRHA